MAHSGQLNLDFAPATGYVRGRLEGAATPDGLAVAWFSLCALRAGEREENQDNVVIVDATGKATYLKDGTPDCVVHPDWPSGRLRVGVVDGMGGHQHGREVAESVVARVAEMPAADGPNDLVKKLDALHADLHEKWGNTLRSPGCTLTLLEVVSRSEAWLYHVGDSRLYAMDDDGAVSVFTMDHAPATRALISGQISAESWHREVHQRPGSRISQAFVLGSALGEGGGGLAPELRHLSAGDLPDTLRDKADCRVIALVPGARYLLATDGLWAVPDPAKLVQSRWPAALRRATDAEGALQGLLDCLKRAASEGSSDNTTALLLQVAAQSEK
ncbi:MULTISPECIES: PP2C family protein-serine/threonine phosphatase [unclassified Halorhodospira]|uniref:PP2C family protein-serine/threonine phosphatase n=1 Tax=unclassified Halorhodospira TaxID=2626748 RepID=UPI001EE8EAD7|nr:MULTISPECIES: protein phosphatase 2C domain-containing protein [unclassified Halorhodospira]MCG5541817.1 protein phosphatase 2C domain-containing protein [Halorhodospira sp. M39old]MCG5546900.1 protein phosphatase 2C domain-containing protein [Halorhodospira sp. M38]